MILFGLLLILVGLSVLAILAIPDASFVLFNTSCLPTAYPGQTSGVLETALNFVRGVEIVAFLLILAGLVLAGIGMVRKD